DNFLINGELIQDNSPAKLDVLPLGGRGRRYQSCGVEILSSSLDSYDVPGDKFRQEGKVFEIKVFIVNYLIVSRRQTFGVHRIVILDAFDSRDVDPFHGL